MKKWYAIQLFGNRKSAFESLQEVFGERAYDPRIMKHESKRKKGSEDIQLWIGYSVAYLDAEEGNDFELMKSDPRLQGCKIVKFGDYASPLASPLIEMMIENEKQNGVYDPKNSKFIRSQKVMIKEGALNGYYAKIKKLFRKKAILIIEDIEGNELQEVEMDMKSLEVAV